MRESLAKYILDHIRQFRRRRHMLELSISGVTQFLLDILVNAADGVVRLEEPFRLFSPLFYRLPRFRDEHDRFLSRLDIDEDQLPSKNVYRTHALCLSCQRFLRKSNLVFGSRLVVIPNWEKHLFCSSLNVLEKSALEDHCHLCTLAWYLLVNDREPAILEAASDKVIFVLIRNATNEVAFLCEGLEWRRQYKMILYKAGTKQDFDAEREYEIYPSNPVINAPSKAYVDLMRYWLRECDRKHTNCRLTDSSFFPTRLIHVGTEDGRTPIHLTSPKRTTEKIVYCTLSHRWDASNVFLLLTENVKDLQNRIDFENLSKTFQDAILVTRRLGVEYIWIDSLCIIQNAPDDWNREAVTMADVYESSYLTICGPTDEVVDNKYTPELWNPLTRHSCRVAGTVGEAGLYIRVPDGTRPVQGTCQSDLPGHKSLLARGWIFQERLLSCRMLYISDREIYWVCVQGTASQYDPHGPRYHQPIHNSRVTDERIVKRAAWFGGSERAVLEEICTTEWEKVRKHPNIYRRHDWWFKLVDAYTKCQLTKETDRLMALSGIAQRVQRATGWSYVAGLWKEHIMFGLRWQTTMPAVNRKRTYVAPSWSWASVTTEITGFDVEKYFSRYTTHWNEEDLVEVLEVSTATHKLDTMGTGQVFGGNLELFGYLFPATRAERPTSDATGSQQFSIDGSEDEFEHQSENTSKIDVQGESEDEEAWENTPDVFGTIQYDSLPLNEEFGEIFIIPFTRDPAPSRRWQSSGSDTEHREMNGLAVCRRSGKEYYERVGYWEYSSGGLFGCHEDLPFDWENLGEKQEITIK